jgi:hypothetical protein
MIATRLAVALLLAPCTLLAQARPPGYDGPFPSADGEKALAAVRGEEWEDSTNRFGGGAWQIERGGVTPHPLGPARADVSEMRSATVKGPHVRLVQATRAVCVPTRCDGDVVALLRLLGKDVPEGLDGEPSAEWQQAMERMQALGGRANGMRVGLLRSPGKDAVLRLLFWNAGDEKSKLRGTAYFLVDGTALSVEVRWPPKVEVPAETSALDLEPGSTFEHVVDLRVLAAQEPAVLGEQSRELEFVFQPELGRADAPSIAVRSKKLTLTAAEQGAIRGQK